MYRLKDEDVKKLLVCYGQKQSHTGEKSKDRQVRLVRYIHETYGRGDAPIVAPEAVAPPSSAAALRMKVLNVLLNNSKVASIDNTVDSLMLCR